MDSSAQEAAFEAWRQRPDQDTLLRLLEAHQDAVFNVCHQVLRHRQDAEDAAQQALIQVAHRAHSLREPRAFRLWLYRVSVHSALMLRRARRPLPLDARSPDMTPPEESRLREELVSALDRLGDEDRGLLVDHYFEKATLEELGRRDGISAAAVWKRLQSAKESLRALMAGAGASLALASIASALGEVPRASAPANLVGPALLAKAGGAGLLVGGTMAAKHLALHTTVLVALFCFAAGLGGGIWARASGSEPSAPSRTADPGRRTDPLRPEPGPEAAAAPATPAPPAPSAPAQLGAELARFIDWLRNGQPPSEPEDYLPEMERRFPDLRDQILADPATYLKALESETDPAILARLTAILGLERVLDYRAGSYYFVEQMTPEMLPPELLDGLTRLLTSGSSALQAAILGLTESILSPPPSLAAAHLRLLDHSEQQVRLRALTALARNLQPVPADRLPHLITLSKEMPHWSRGSAFAAIARIPGPHVDELLARELTVGSDVRNGFAHLEIAGAVADRIFRSGHLLSQAERDRYLAAIGATLSQPSRTDRSECRLAKCAVRLSPHQARSILGSVRERFTGRNLEILDRLLEQIADGATPEQIEETMSPWP